MRVKVSTKRFVALIFALMPILRLYSIPVIQRGLGAGLIYFVSILYVLWMILTNKKFELRKKLVIKELLAIMSAYVIIHHIVDLCIGSYTENVQIIFFFTSVYLVTMMFCDDELRDIYRKYVENIALFMSGCVMLQCIAYYFGGFIIGDNRFFLLPFQEMLSMASSKYLGLGSMVTSGGGLFRPSAFFMEPSHFTEYCVMGLISLMLRDKKVVRFKTVFVSLGMILTTSGLGICMTIVLWFYMQFVKTGKISINTLLKLVSRCVIF